MRLFTKRICPETHKIIWIISINIEVLTKVPIAKGNLPWERRLKTRKIRPKIMVKVRIEIVSRLSNCPTSIRKLVWSNRTLILRHLRVVQLIRTTWKVYLVKQWVTLRKRLSLKWSKRWMIFRIISCRWLMLSLWNHLGEALIKTWIVLWEMFDWINCSRRLKRIWKRPVKRVLRRVWDWRDRKASRNRSKRNVKLVPGNKTEETAIEKIDSRTNTWAVLLRIMKR